jgi:transcription antitermination protein NusB
VGKINLRARHRARRLALQAIYQWQLTDDAVDSIKVQYMTENDAKTFEVEYFLGCLQAVCEYARDFDAQMTPFLDRSLDSITPIELALLRMGMYELVMRLDVPYKVVINEAVGLGKLFGATDSYRYINGVLDKVAREIRKLEISGVG